MNPEAAHHLEAARKHLSRAFIQFDHATSVSRGVEEFLCRGLRGEIAVMIGKTEALRLLPTTFEGREEKSDHDT